MSFCNTVLLVCITDFCTLRRMKSKSVLDGVSELMVHGRAVIVDLAVERGKAAELTEQLVRQKDKRNLYLLNEGGM